MTKFFVPLPRGAPKGFAHPPKVKKGKTSCSQSLQKKVMEVLKKLVTRQKQKTIRKLHEQKEEAEKPKLVAKLEHYKSISKHNLKHLSYFILLDELNVEQSSLKKFFAIPAKEEQKELPEHVKIFYETIKGKSLYSNEIEDAQRIKNQVSEKKKIKKDKAKLKKKTKVAIRKENQLEKGEPASDSEAAEEEEEADKASKDIEEAEIDQSDSPDFQPVNKPPQPHTQRPLPPTKPQRTQFKKTGRNKFLQEKRNKKPGFGNRIEAKPFVKQTRPQPVRRDETPHPSWQAKRQIKNQMFIQPFQGKRILL